MSADNVSMGQKSRICPTNHIGADNNRLPFILTDVFDKLFVNYLSLNLWKFSSVL